MKKILIIDDDADLRATESTLLSDKYEIREAGSKKEGYQILEVFVPDLIVLDVMMESPSSGFEMSRELKDSERFSNIKILMLTNVDNEFNIDFKSEALDPRWLPVDDYIVKPLEPRTFLKKIEALLS